MRFLVDADLPKACMDLLRSAGHDAVSVRDIGLAAASDQTIARLARDQARVMLTGDFDFADIRHYPPRDYPGIVVLELEPTSTTPAILAQLRAFLLATDLLDQLPGRLAIVAVGRVRFHPRLTDPE